MSRNRKSNTLSFSKNLKKTKGGYKINRNGVPLDKNGKNVYQTKDYNY